jgi:hypothetical protein
MIWTTWRQHRAEAGVGALVVAALASAMLVVGSVARDRAHALGLPACTSDRGNCSKALSGLHSAFHTIPPFIAALVAVPLLAGMFWAAPLVSREYEAGTHRLAWTQAVSPRRWITTKIALIFAVIAAAALGLGLLATWALDPLVPAFGGRFNSTWYDTQGIVPVACIVFALAVGVAISALIRRTIPAMALTLVTYAAARIPVHWFRPHFWPATTRTYAAPFSALLDRPTGSPQSAFASQTSPTDWVISSTITDPSGHAVVPLGSNLDVLSNYCPDLQTGPLPSGTRAPPLPSRADLAACRPKVANLSLQETISYQPASHFWLVQAAESAIFLGISALLVAAAVLAVARHRSI